MSSDSVSGSGLPSSCGATVRGDGDSGRTNNKGNEVLGEDVLADVHHAVLVHIGQVPDVPQRECVEIGLHEVCLRLLTCEFSAVDSTGRSAAQQ